MVDLFRISVGLSGQAQIVVGPEHTAPFVGSWNGPAVLLPHRY